MLTPLERYVFDRMADRFPVDPAGPTPAAWPAFCREFWTPDASGVPDVLTMQDHLTHLVRTVWDAVVGASDPHVLVRIYPDRNGFTRLDPEAVVVIHRSATVFYDGVLPLVHPVSLETFCLTLSAFALGIHTQTAPYQRAFGVRSIPLITGVVESSP